MTLSKIILAEWHPAECFQKNSIYQNDIQQSNTQNNVINQNGTLQSNTQNNDIQKNIIQ